MSIPIKCDVCNIQFNRYPSQISSRKNHFCSLKCMGEFQRKDLTGKFFEKLEVLEFDSIKKYTGGTCSIFKCRCSCGAIVFLSGGSLTSGHSTKCKKCSNRKYIGEVSGAYFCNLKKHAKKRNIYFDITQSDISEKFLEQDRKCVYSGLELTWQDGFYGKRGVASVDRVDNKVGYIKENIQIVHKDVNWMKLNHTEEYFLTLCKNISGFNGTFLPIPDYIINKNNHHRTGYREISGSHWANIIWNARKGKIEFSITIEYAWDLYLKQGGVCALSGLSIKFEPSYNRMSEKTASLDRIDSSLGYIESNIQWTHKDVNKMKGDLYQEHFINLCKSITER